MTETDFVLLHLKYIFNEAKKCNFIPFCVLEMYFFGLIFCYAKIPKLILL